MWAKSESSLLFKLLQTPIVSDITCAVHSYKKRPVPPMETRAHQLLTLFSERILPAVYVGALVLGIIRFAVLNYVLDTTVTWYETFLLLPVRWRGFLHQHMYSMIVILEGDECTHVCRHIKKAKWGHIGHSVANSVESRVSCRVWVCYRRTLHCVCCR